jgi:hypothetical protein
VRERDIDRYESKSERGNERKRGNRTIEKEGMEERE